MGTGLIQLAIYGSQDVFLTGNPQITFFKAVYRKHTHFALQSFAQEFIDRPNFGTDNIVVLDRIGDLIHRSYLEIEIPEVRITTNPQQCGISTNRNRTIPGSVDPRLVQYNRLVSTFIEVNVEIVRKLMDMLIPLNIGFPSIIDSMTNPKSISALLKARSDLQSFLETTDFSTRLSPEEIVNLIHRTDAQLVFLSQVSNVWNQSYTNSSCENETLPEDITIIKNSLRNTFSSNGPYYQALQELQLSAVIKIDEASINQPFAWSCQLGNSLIEKVEVVIGTNTIDTQTGSWYIASNQQIISPLQQVNYNEMIGNVPAMTCFDEKPKPSYRLIIPLQFWFCRFVGLSLPLIALRYQDIMINVKFRELAEVCTFCPTEVLPDAAALQDCFNINFKNARLWVDYIFLGSDERKRFATYTHEYLIETIQLQEYHNVMDHSFVAPMEFINPVKYLLWFIQPEMRRNPLLGNACQWCNFAINDDGTGQPLTTTGIRVNYINLTNQDFDIEWFNSVQPSYYFNNSPSPGIYTYSFALKPLEHQPSGTLNASRIDNLAIRFKINPVFAKRFINETLPHPGFYVGIYAVTYNILRIFGGMADVAFH